MGDRTASVTNQRTFGCHDVQIVANGDRRDPERLAEFVHGHSALLTKNLSDSSPAPRW
jgi:hypothetical protein